MVEWFPRYAWTPERTGLMLALGAMVGLGAVGAVVPLDGPWPELHSLAFAGAVGGLAWFSRKR